MGSSTIFGRVMMTSSKREAGWDDLYPVGVLNGNSCNQFSQAANFDVCPARDLQQMDREKKTGKMVEQRACCSTFSQAVTCLDTRFV